MILNSWYFDSQGLVTQSKISIELGNSLWIYFEILVFRIQPQISIALGNFPLALLNDFT